MFLSRGSRALRTQFQICKGMSRVAVAAAASGRYPARAFHMTRNLQVIKPVLLADIGEGIVECEIIQWFVEPGARVEEFSPLCEVQSDKASVEITSRFAGVVKKLHYEAGEMAKVGKPFVDIDIQGDAKKEDLEALTPSEPAAEPSASTSAEQPTVTQEIQQAEGKAAPPSTSAPSATTPEKKGKHAGLATPAVRHLSKEKNIDITQINGTGKDGRVLKEDIFKFIESRDSGASAEQSSPSPFAPPPAASGVQEETPVPLTNTQLMMFKTMTRSLSIPHFLYSDEIDITSLSELRARLNKVLAQQSGPETGDVRKLSYLPFIIKAVSLALYRYPVLNARVDSEPEGPGSKPRLVHRSQHNIGVAMDTPQGLLVPMVRDVGARNVLSIASELQRLQALAQAGRLSPQDLSGGTITVSNIGTIGGTYLSPVIVEKEVAIVGVGRVRTVPAFDGDSDRVVRRQVCNFSWSADHRVVDGATMARAAGVVRQVVEEPDVMVMHLR
ncbi:uncharacterized protein E0L32_000654 [Thyridium curvatum]|uniref:Dihydrolipoamide acetyltransferase component of pyruvate dehydrogenase complex n=1 Tax=Thyridium curvatum TaxID=1093900 RepID=A0A507BCE0_9PEZI|nr:uncharacterized protein E0L32_000654 [Thyridium curvatum]TPX14260.1 hypothetical protein E0L32_000654 [Thyridium curvatum]